MVKSGLPEPPRASCSGSCEALMSVPPPGFSAEYTHSQSEMDIQTHKPKCLSQKTAERGQKPKQPDRACDKWADEKWRRKRVPKALKRHKGSKVTKQVTFHYINPAHGLCKAELQHILSTICSANIAKHSIQQQLQYFVPTGWILFSTRMQYQKPSYNLTGTALPLMRNLEAQLSQSQVPYLRGDCL